MKMCSEKEGKKEEEEKNNRGSERIKRISKKLSGELMLLIRRF